MDVTEAVAAIALAGAAIALIGNASFVQKVGARVWKWLQGAL